MSKIYLITHPEVIIDPKKDIEKWDLSPIGKERTHKLATQDWWKNISHIFTSEETKAITTTKIISELTHIPYTSHAELNENDRSSTGFLPYDEFMKQTMKFFEFPEDSQRGWETAFQAQERICDFIQKEILAQKIDKLAIIGHGGTLGLFLAKYFDKPISFNFVQKDLGSMYILDTDLDIEFTSWSKF